MAQRCGVLFDLDGVLVATETLKAETHAATIARFGGSIDMDFYRLVMGQSQDYVATTALRLSGLEVSVPEYNLAFGTLYAAALARGVVVNRGARELLTELHGRHFLLAVVSSSPREVVDRVLEQAELRSLLSATVSASEVLHHKPAPDAYMEGLRCIALEPAQCVAFEDSDPGVVAAQASGLSVVAVRHGFNGTHGFCGAHAVVGGLEDTAAIMQLINQIVATTPNAGGL